MENNRLEKMNPEDEMTLGEKKDEWVDDGKTIVNMNVDGMPWYRPELPDEPEEGFKPISLSQEEGRAAMWGALKAALLVAGIFILGFFLFLLFCDNIWLK